MTGWWQRLTGRAPKVEPTVEAKPEESPITAAELTDYARSVIYPGFTDLADAREQVGDYVEDSPGAPDAATVDRVVQTVWQQRLDAQRGWTDEGDYGRLAAAFGELEQRGFTVRMDFTCCQNCGHTEIEDERAPGQHSYAFFHRQDSERLADPDAELYLAYSYFAEHPDYDRDLMLAARESDDDELRGRAREQHNRLETAVGAELVETLTRHGLRVSWSGTNESRPAVQVSDWRKRLPVESQPGGTGLQPSPR